MNVRTRATKPQSARQTPTDGLRQAVEQHQHGASEYGLVLVRLLGGPTAAHGQSSMPSLPSSELFQALADRIRPLIRRTDDLLMTDEGIAVVLRTPGRDGARCVYQRIVEMANILEAHTEQLPLTNIVHRSSRRTHRTNTDATHHQIIGIGFASSVASADLHLSPRGRRTKNHLPENVGSREFDALFTQAWEPQAQVTLSTTALIQATPKNALAAEEHKECSDLEEDREDREAGVVAVLRRRAEAVGAPFIHLPARLTPTCQRAIPYELARELRAIPVGRTRTTLTIAMERPQDAQALRRLRLATGLIIFPVLGASDEIERALTLLAE